jgi:glycyl-tRNA synthetase beta chain
MPELIFEIGCEELPADSLTAATKGLEEQARQLFTQHRIPFEGLAAWSTPRRLTLVVREMGEKQASVKEQVLGPAWNVAFTPDGKPTRAAEGFAAKQGVPVTSLKKATTEKGTYVSLERRLKAERTRTLLPDLLTELLRKVPFPKSMRWGEHPEAFGRPVHWLLALYAGGPVRVTFTGIRSGTKTRGHRFMAPKPFAVKTIDGYVEGLRAAYVIVDPEERRQRIAGQLAEAASARQGSLIVDEGLLAEVTNLVEWPVALAGQIDSRFLEIPRDVIVTSMRDHQRYFSLEDRAGKLLPYFITISNIIARDPEVVIAGNRRVLAARLTDAMFFVREDVKIPLGDRIEALKGVVFQVKLGTIHDKVERFTALALNFNTRLGLVDEAKLIRAASLAKADLTSGMVGEFPELQGVIGAEYAQRQGEDAEVVAAIQEHYLPRGADDALPAGHLGALVAMADKLDTVVGCFGVGLIPTGAADPYALRRLALGTLNIIFARQYPILFGEMVDAALDGLAARLTRPRDEVRVDVLQFFRGRFENLMRTKGMAPDEIEAVLARGFDAVMDARERLEALHRFRQDAAFEALASAFKRAANIVQKELGEQAPAAIDATLFEVDAERDLLRQLDALAGDVGRLFAERRYEEALRVVSGLREPVDRFFNDVLVVAPDARVRDNRLALLARLRDLFESFADFTRLSGAQTPA